MGAQIADTVSGQIPGPAVLVLALASAVWGLALVINFRGIAERDLGVPNAWSGAPNTRRAVGGCFLAIGLLVAISIAIAWIVH